MAKFPREEISYRRFYKSLDLDKELGINWPIVEERDIEIIEENSRENSAVEFFQTDAFDERFYETNLAGVEKEEYENYLKLINFNFNRFLMKKVDRIKEEIRLTHEYSGEGDTSHYCDVCAYSDSEPSNRLIVCQGCGVATHMECYGVVETGQLDGAKDRSSLTKHTATIGNSSPMTKDSQAENIILSARSNSSGETQDSSPCWLCTKCVYHFDVSECGFCNDSSGLLKPTTTGGWIHVTCALLHPNINFKNEILRDPVEVEGFEFIEGECDCCQVFCKALIKCSYESCGRHFDCSCAIEKCYCDINNRRIYCRDHDPTNEESDILSRNNRMEQLLNYSPLEYEIFERESKPHGKLVKTVYQDVVELKPFIISEGYSGVLLEPEFIRFKALIDEYWITKRLKFGTYFEDPFMIPNRFLHKNSNKSCS